MSLVNVNISHCGREEVDLEASKRLKHYLAMIPLSLNPEDLGFNLSIEDRYGVTKTGESPKKRGKPRSSWN